MEVRDDSRDYDVRKLRHLDDERFTAAFKEMLFAEGVFFGTILLVMAAAYGLCPEDMSLLTYIMGFPAWFFGAMCVIFAVWGFVLFHSAKLSRNFSLEARAEEEVREDV